MVQPQRPISAPRCIARMDLADKLGQRRSMRFSRTGRSGGTLATQDPCTSDKLSCTVSQRLWHGLYTEQLRRLLFNTFIWSFTADAVPLRQAHGAWINGRPSFADPSDCGKSVTL